MDTKLYGITSDSIDTKLLEDAAKYIKNGELVAFPTETVYGLGADGLNCDAVKKIFIAKGRPSDNPLILHIHSVQCLDKIVSEITENATLLTEAFWPGPLTVIFKKNDSVPDAVTAGLDTVAVRLPQNEIARKFIELCDTPIAAPSANTSGRPSPTSASHVIDDLFGKVAAIIDGGDCDIGLESTVVDASGEFPIILRPGKITLEDIQVIIPGAVYDKHLTEKVPVSRPKSPGMKYKHYAPRGELYILSGGASDALCYIKENSDETTGIITFDEYKTNLPHEYSLGSENDFDSAAHRLFGILRAFDDEGMTKIFAFMPQDKGVGFAVCNRMLKAAGGKIINTAG